MKVFCGIDWAEGHHDIALVDELGWLVAERRINETVAGFAELTAMLAAPATRPRTRSRRLSRPRAACSLRVAGHRAAGLLDRRAAAHLSQAQLPGEADSLAARRLPLAITAVHRTEVIYPRAAAVADSDPTKLILPTCWA